MPRAIGGRPRVDSRFWFTFATHGGGFAALWVIVAVVHSAPLDWPSWIVASAVVGLAGAWQAVDRAGNVARRAPADPEGARAWAAARADSVPADPQVRVAALRFVTHDLAVAKRTRVLVVALAGLIVAGFGSLAVTTSPWYLLFTVPAVLMVHNALVRRPRALRRRIKELRGRA